MIRALVATSDSFDLRVILHRPLGVVGRMVPIVEWNFSSTWAAHAAVRSQRFTLGLRCKTRVSNLEPRRFHKLTLWPSTPTSHEEIPAAFGKIFPSPTLE